MKKIKLFFALFAMLALGVGNAWGAALGSGYEKVTNISSLTTGDKVVLYCDDVSVGVTGWNGNSDATVAASGFVEYLVTVVSGGVTLKDESAGKYIAQPTGNHFKYNATAGTCSVNASGVIACNSRYLYQNGTYYRMYEDKSSNSNYKPFYVYKVVTTGGGETPDPTTYTIKWHTAKGVTTDVTLNEGATITKPANDPTMTGYEFMGWTEDCEVASDGAGFTAIENFGTATEDKDYYAVFAVATTSGGGAATDVTIDLSTKNQITTNTTSSLVFTEGDVTFTNTKLSGSTAANNYCPGTSGKTYTSTRTYNGHQVTIAAANTISKIVITAGTASYATAIKNAAWTNATASVENTTITVTPDADATSVSFKPSATAGMTKVVVTTGGGSTTYSDYTTSCSGSEEQVASLTVNPNSLDFGTYKLESSAEKQTQKLTIKGANLTSNVILSVAAPFEIQGGTTTLTPSAGAIDQEITLVYNPTAEGTHTGSLTISSTDIADKTVSLKGEAIKPYTITWQVVEGATAPVPTKVYAGEAIGTLPEADDCPEGKVFMGWTAATEVNNDGSSIVYVKETDIPTSDMTYYAVFAVVTSTGEPVTSYKKVTTISDGTYLIAATSGTSSYAYTGQVEGKKFGGYIAVTIANDEITAKPAEAAEITVKVTDGKFSMHDGNKYLYLSSSANELHYNDAEQIVWALDAEGKINITTYNSRYLKFNATSGNERFACYSSAQKDAFLYKKVTTTPETASDYSLDCTIHTEPTWTISKDAIDFADKYVGVSYTETFTISASNLTDDIALAIDGSNFTVSPTSISKDATFPQTVTVTYAPTAAGTHNADLTITSGELSETITLTGQAETPTIYTLTDLADIKAKDQVIIVGTNANGTYAMSNNNGTGSAPTAVAVTVSNNEIKTNDATILWNIVKDGDNLTFYPNGTTETWLYCTSTNNGVRVGTNDNKVFIIDSESGYLKHTGTSRYLGIYNNQDWRCYENTTGNTKDQTFAFYVLPNTDPSIDVNPESQDFVVALNSSASQEVEITAHNIAAPAYSTSISGDTYFTATVNAGKVTVTYAPTVVGEHAATLTITETTSSQTATVALTGKCVEAVDVATAMATDDNTIVALKPFEVVKVISAKNYVYIKDATGASLIFDYNDAHSMGSLVEGATVNGFVGKKGAYNKNPQLTPSVDYSALSVSGSGTAVATEITEVKAEYVNEFVVLKGVEITSNVNINTDPTLSVNDKDVAFRNQFERNFEFQADMLYDIYGFVGVYNETVQFWFLEAAEAGSTIEYYTVTYEKGASDVQGNVPVDTKEYAEGETVTLKPCELTREGYTFDGWNVTSTNGTVDVANNQFIMPGADVTATALWEEVKTYDQGAWVLVTDASELTVDDDVIIAAANANDNYALGIDQKSNNRGTSTIIKGSNVALLESDVQILTLKNGNKSGTLALSTGNGYLYAASSDKNYLRTETSLSDNSSWTIEINEGVATIKAQGTNTHNLLQYNRNSEIFSCYLSAQEPVAIYEYNPNERVITFDVNGGEAYAHTYVATTDGILIVPTEVPTHAAEGQLFDSWNDKQDGSGNTYNAGDIFSFSEHTVLYAQWTVADAYHVTYNIAGASGTTPVDANHYYGGENITLAPQGDLVNPGHIFAGWKVVDATDTEIMVTDNAFIMPQSDVTATAKWVRQTNDTWVLVTSENQLLVGEKYVIACNTEGAVAGNINTTATNPYMYKLDAAFSDNKELIKALTPEAVVFTLGGTTDAWTFTNESGKALGATAAKKMAWGSGTTTWLLTFDANGALTMKNATDANGSLKYNSQSPRFTTYASGQTAIQLYVLNPAQVVEGEKTDDEVPQYSNVTIENGGDLSVENSDTQYGDMYINNGGSVEVDDNAQLTVNNLYIQTTMGTTTSGQLNTAPENLIVNGDVFIDITLGKNGDSSQWHAFTVPFPVDAMNGVYDLNDNQLKNEVNYAIMDYHGDIRANGQYGWKKYRGVLVPGTFYLMTVDGERTTYRFKKVKDADLVAANTKSLVAYSGDGEDIDQGWNGVGNPTLMHGKVDATAQILDPETYTYKTITASSAHFTVGTPFFIQAATDGTMTMVAETSASLAPARHAATAVENIKVMLGNSDYTDYLYVSASEDATNEYEIGKDLAKMTMTKTPSVPQIFAEAYNTSLCMIDAPMANNEAVVALNLYAPAEGEYTISTDLQENAIVYLMQEGTIVWNLSMGEYPITLKQGDNAGYSLLVRRADAPTSVETIEGANNQTDKLIHNGNLYILHNGKIFDAVGSLLK